ncbi:Nuclear transport factor 2 (NTF2) family protein [Striga hermonthica]|uniref:Nuclear transport factor 2 (NTF2) family protein n=1 Tax=Striga hermonthica TaxID=68872 RepID=A0A9N7NML1_STRHE|nr:Nuclear transport factor 2 (NTF2) family protein [Striga hermonthica]
MEAPVRFSNTITRQIMLPTMRKKVILTNVPLNRTPQPRQANVYVMLPSPTYTKRRAVRRKPQKLFAKSYSDCPTPLSPPQTIMLFYSAINEKNMKQLDGMIAEDCFFDDFSFPKPFQGKKEVMRFLEQLIMSMGQNMQFNIEHICGGEDNSVGVNWHLDWNKIQVPFTRGCSNYSLSLKVDKLVIEKAQTLVESPIKLGIAALTIFKIVSSLFDAFPAATEWFLTSPHVMFQLLLKAFKLTIQPIIGPFLAWYIKLLNTGACILSFTLKILYHLSKNIRN